MMFAAAVPRALRPASVTTRPLSAALLRRGLATESNAPTSAYNKEKDADGLYTVTLFSGDGTSRCY